MCRNREIRNRTDITGFLAVTTRRAEKIAPIVRKSIRNVFIGNLEYEKKNVNTNIVFLVR